jgi:hypothetical protein
MAVLLPQGNRPILSRASATVSKAKPARRKRGLPGEDNFPTCHSGAPLTKSAVADLDSKVTTSGVPEIDGNPE